jgi:hypothetical protein
MGKKRTREEDLGILKKKVAEGQAKGESPGNDSLRTLHKHLKRTQRKVRSRAARIAQAAGKKKLAAAS